MSNTVRQEKYADRVKASWECLLADVYAWEKTFKKRQNGLMAFHAQQFGTFCKNAHDRLMAEYEQDLRKKIRPSTGSGRAVGETPIASSVRGEPVEPCCVSPDEKQSSQTGESDDERLKFELFVIGALTSQWMLLRQVCQQRLPGNPYKEKLQELDRKAVGYYRQVASVFTQEKICPPLTYLGRIDELLLFSRDAPLLLSVPFGVMTQPKIDAAIAHEIGHAFLALKPTYFSELRNFLVAAFSERKNPQIEKTFETRMMQQDFPVFPSVSLEPGQQRFVIHKTILGWLGEIVADIVGTMLGGVEFVEQAIWMLASSEDAMQISDAEHPMALLRLYVHLATLQYLRENGGCPDFSTVEDEINAMCGMFLEQRCKSLSDSVLTIVSFEKVKAALLGVVALILTTPFPSLSNASLGEVMRQARNIPAVCDINTGELPKWGEMMPEADEPFVLELADSLRLDYPTPEALPQVFAKYWDIPLLDVILG